MMPSPGAICDLPFNVVGLPKKMGGMLAHPSAIRQSPDGFFGSLRNGGASRHRRADLR